MELIDNDGIVHALKGIVETFSNSVSPYAYELVVHLKTAFDKYNEKSNTNEEDEGEGELAAAGCLSAIKQILSASLKKEFYLQI